MSLENVYSQMEIAPRQNVDRYAEYPGPSHEQALYYPYEPSPGPQVPVVTKHHYGGHKGNAAMSALTLLAFLFFLHILQQCLKDHMNAMGTPQVVVMTGGREGENHAKTHKVDKTGVTDNDKYKNEYNNASQIYDDDDDEKYLTKITTSENVPWKKSKNQNIFKHFNNRSTSYGYNPMDY